MLGSFSWNMLIFVFYAQLVVYHNFRRKKKAGFSRAQTAVSGLNLSYFGRCRYDD